MMKQLFFAGLLLAAGLFLVLSNFLKLPTLKAAKAMLGAGKESKKAAKTVEAWLMSGAVKLARHIRMDEYKRARMANVLKAAGYSMTPEVYTAYALTKSGAILLGVIPCLLLLPLLTPLVVILAVLSYFKETRKADEQLKTKRDQIEGELPRFVATVEQSLKASRDVLAMLEAYKKNAGPAFAHELDVLTADMRSSSYEAALTRFEARFNSPMLSDVVRGLIAAAEKMGAPYAVDVYPRYGSDVEATLRAGYDIRHGLIGSGVYASHGYERSHVEGALATLKTLIGYVG